MLYSEIESEILNVSQKMPLWHKYCFEPKATENQQVQEKLFTSPEMPKCKVQKCPFVKDTFKKWKFPLQRESKYSVIVGQEFKLILSSYDCTKAFLSCYFLGSILPYGGMALFVMSTVLPLATILSSLWMPALIQGLRDLLISLEF